MGGQKDVRKLFVLAQEYRLESRLRWAIQEIFSREINSRDVRGESISEEGVVTRALSWLPHTYQENIATSAARASQTAHGPEEPAAAALFLFVSDAPGPVG